MKKHTIVTTIVLYLTIIAAAFAQTPTTTAINLPNRIYSVVWDQGGTTVDLAQSFQYTVYVDGIGSVVDHLCGNNLQSGAVQCAAPMPPLTGGNHTLEISAADISVPDSPQISAKSATLLVRVVVVPRTPANPRLELK